MGVDKSFFNTFRKKKKGEQITNTEDQLADPELDPAPGETEVVEDSRKLST